MKRFARTFAAAEKVKKRKPPAMAQASLDNLRPGRIELIEKAPKCIFMVKSTGERCKRPRVRGARKCYNHGGLKEVPEHPANIRKALSGELSKIVTNYESQLKFQAYPRDIKQTVIATKGKRRLKAVVMLAGAQALEQQDEDGGRAWFRWVQNLPPLPDSS